MKITDFKISGTRLGTILHHCRLILETETEPGTKIRFHYLCLPVYNPGNLVFSLFLNKFILFQDIKKVLNLSLDRSRPRGGIINNH